MADTWKLGAPTDSWNKLQSKLSAHFLQQRGWALFQVAQGKTIFHASTNSWSWLAILEKSRFGSRLYAPYGPTAASPQALEQAISSLLDCATAQRVDFIRIEPQAIQAKKVLRRLGAKHAHRDIQPAHTLVKDLNRPDDELYAEMASTNRRLTKRAKATGFTFRTSYDPEDISLFLDMLHEVAKRTGIQPHSDTYYRTMARTLFPIHAATFFTAYHGGKPVTTSITFEDSRTRYYAHAAATEASRKIQPNVYLLGHMIFDAKAKGKQLFDYYGVAPPGASNHTWAGFSRFKRSFGGHEVEYSGTWEIPIKRVRYHAYRAVTKLNHTRNVTKKIVRRYTNT